MTDLLATEAARLRPGRAVPPLPWPAATRLEEDLGADSLERLQLATALAEAIHLHRSGIDDALLTRRTVGEWVDTAASALAGFSAELTFCTSGSTGQPKWCVHRLDDLEAEVALLAGVVGPQTRRVIVAVPAHHIYGFLFTVLLPAQLRAQTLDVRGHTPAVLARLLQPGDAVIGHPDFWRAFVRTVPHAPAGVLGVTSTAPISAILADDVRKTGIERLIDVYGSSETAGIGWRDDPQRPYEVFPYWSRGAGDRDLLRSGATGAQRGYLAPDELAWEDGRHVRPSGRAEGAVQVGGTNVFPERIGALLCTHPGVAQAAVRLMRPEEGERLKAFIVPQPDVDPVELRADLWTWIDARLTTPERPKSIVFGSRLPAGALGKLADWPIADERSNGLETN